MRNLGLPWRRKISSATGLFSLSSGRRTFDRMLLSSRRSSGISPVEIRAVLFKVRRKLPPDPHFFLCGRNGHSSPHLGHQLPAALHLLGRRQIVHLPLPLRVADKFSRVFGHRIPPSRATGTYGGYHTMGRSANALTPQPHRR